MAEKVIKYCYYKIPEQNKKILEELTYRFLEKIDLCPSTQKKRAKTLMSRFSVSHLTEWSKINSYFFFPLLTLFIS